MCYAIPGKVKAIQDKIAIVDYFGEEKKAHNEMMDLKVGDYIYAQGGFVIRKISAHEAEEILLAWKDMFFALQEVDREISRLDQKQAGLDKKFSRILDRAMEGHIPSKEEMLYLLNCSDEKQLEYLFKAANFLRQKHLKNSCCVHGILEISNFCERSCLYCGISKRNKNLKRYRMTKTEIIDAAYEAIEKYGFKALVLQSGEEPGYSVSELADIVKTIKAKAPVLIVVSFGEVGLDGLKQLYDAGARGLLMRFETSNPDLYEKLHPGQKLSTRLDHIRRAYELGYLIFTGALIGLPNQTKKDIIEDIFLAKELNAEMVSFGPFLPHQNTPLRDVKPLAEIEILKVLALLRLADPENARILITTAFETLSPDARRQGLLAGGSSVMLNVTPVQCREQYTIYPNRVYTKTPIQEQIDETVALLGSLGRAPTDLGAK